MVVLYYLESRQWSTLGEAWPTMDDANKDYCVSRVAEICTQVAVWEIGFTISCIDGLKLSDHFLAGEIGNVTTNDLSPSKLLENCWVSD